MTMASAMPSKAASSRVTAWWWRDNCASFPAAKSRSATGDRRAMPTVLLLTCRHEHLESLHRTSCLHHAADGGIGYFRPVRLFHLAGQRIAAGGLPHHLRLGQPAGRGPLDHGVLGGDA